MTHTNALHLYVIADFGLRIFLWKYAIRNS